MRKKILLVPLALLAMYFLLKEPTMTDIVNAAAEACKDVTEVDNQQVYCMLGNVKEYCDKHWKYEACHKVEQAICR